MKSSAGTQWRHSQKSQMNQTIREIIIIHVDLGDEKKFIEHPKLP